MKVTYTWLKDFVEIKISPQVLAQKLTMAGLEVTSLEKRAGDLRRKGQFFLKLLFDIRYTMGYNILPREGV